MLTLKHFDTDLSRWVNAFDISTNNQTIFTEELNNSMLEAIFPDAPKDAFSIGYIHEWTAADNLTRHPDNSELLFSSGNRCFYGPIECKEELDKIFPDEKDKGAYGSLLSGNCLDTFQTKVKLLIVEDDLESDSCGENGGLLPRDAAVALVGDCHGKISPQLLQKFVRLDGELQAQTVSGEPDEIIRHAVQHRLFFPDCDSHPRIAKGTVAAKNLEPLFEPDRENVPDLILPVSSFKGGTGKPHPGLYSVDLWAGAKNISQTTLSSTAEVGLDRDAREILKEAALHLNEIAADPRKVAELFCKSWEEKASARGEISRKMQQENTAADRPTAKSNANSVKIEGNTANSQLIEEYITNSESIEENTANSQLLSENITYKILKADLAGGHGQLLECKYIQKQLERFLQSQRREIATGGAIKWRRSSIIIPSKDLNDDRVCTAVGGEGEIIMSFRSPLLYEDAIALQYNTFTPDCLDPKGRSLIGVSAVSDEPYYKLANRKAAEFTGIKGIDISDGLRNKTDLHAGETQQEFAARSFSEAWERREISQLQSPTQKQLAAVKSKRDQWQNLLLKSLPLDTYSKRAGEDYDGDSKCFAPAAAWPYTALHLIEAQNPQNAHPPTPKLPKLSFEVPGQPKKRLAEIALFMANKWTELANSAVKCVAAVESEVMAVQSAFDAEQKENYLRDVSNYFQQKLQDDRTGTPKKSIPQSVVETVRELAGIHSSSTNPQVTASMAGAGLGALNALDYKLCCKEKQVFPIPPERVEIGLETYRKFLRFQVTPPLLLQNQIAVDSKKSATPADEIAIAQYRNLCHRNPNYLQDKKLPDIYLEGKVIEPNGYSLKESIIQTLNPLLQASRLEARPFYQFRNLFPEPEPGDKYYYTPEQYDTCREVKAAFDSLFNSAVATKLRLQTESGPYLTARTESGIDVEITNVAPTKYPERFKNRQSLEVLLVANETYRDSTANNHKICVLAKTQDSSGSDRWMKIGTLSESSRQLLRVPAKIEKPLYLKLQNVAAVPAFTQTQCSLLFKQAVQLAEKFQSECQEKGETDAMAAATWHLCCAPENNAGGSQKTQNFAFAAWGSQIADRLGELQFKELTVGELNSGSIAVNSCIKNAEIRIGAVQTGESKNSEIYRTEPAKSEVDRTSSNRHLNNPAIGTDAAANDSSKNSPIASKRTLEILTGGEYVAAGTISDSSAQLPIGTTARAELIPALAKTATLQIPGCETPVKVGKVAECDFGGQSSLAGGEYAIAILAINKPKYLLATAGKVIGELDEASIESLARHNCLHDNFSFTASLTTCGIDNGTHTIAKSRSGNILRARKQNLIGGFKDFRFQGTQTTVSVNVQQKTEICAAVVTESGLKILGVFTPNQKESKIALIKAFGKQQSGKSDEMLKKEFDAGKLAGASFKARIEFNSTTFVAALEPGSIQYPVPPARSPESDRQPPEKVESIGKVRQVVAIVNSPPTLFYEFDKPAMSDGKITAALGLGVAVSLRKAETARKFFESCQIEYKEIDPLDAFVAEETRRGYAVFHFSPDSLPPKIMSSLVKQFGEPLAKDLSGGSPYFQKLRESPPLPERAILLLQKFYGMKKAESSIAPESSIVSEELQTIRQQNRNNSPMPAWEKNLIAAAVRAASDNNYSPRTPFMQNTLLATYCPESKTVTVVRSRDNSTIYSRELGKDAAATIDLSREQKQFLESYKLPTQKEIQL
ncbi:MAG: hypothetical protein EAZ94_23975 [Oscillatoriales cyanobacterium]|uniref:hypothetical protein n=1 Tax=unclassified Microcoleus TaxID=2642155 RepID=UPI001DB33057|nr:MULTISPECIES: hypothetical protein [unclassified Microcoleus]MCC3595843.1 hypothetical protein [Microcoleus sp. PH2017_26_ELK_O_A]MCC3620646.1 hypothetical protein [Microcoleus sp. PH2017_36_ELK_O_B]TAE08776.1 MAG: hypothetical protein EAZ94_23975 [Oscillatoriales cyanobacterium]